MDFDHPPHNSSLSISRSPKKLLIRLGVILGLVVLLVAACTAWYTFQLRPVDTSDDRSVKITVAEGESLQAIGEDLYMNGLIRSPFGFRLEVQRNQGAVQVGSYAFTPSQSTQEIVADIISGDTNNISITILPGQRIDQVRDKLIEAGFEQSSVDAAMTKKYDHPVFATSPSDATLEGYLYPDTYVVSPSDSVEVLFGLMFDELYAVIQENNLQSVYKEQGLSLYEGITLASIIQQEASDASDQRQVAQVFLERLDIGMVLGSDVTFIYGDTIAGREPSVSSDSPYNTRRFPGLPPGPIANVQAQSLDSLANPSSGDFLYFVAGDDGTTYFSRTVEEHEAKTEQYCTTLCN